MLASMHETFPSVLLGADNGVDTAKAVGHSVLRADSGDL